MHSISAESFFRTSIKFFLLEKKVQFANKWKIRIQFQAGNLNKDLNLNKIPHFSFSHGYFRPTKPEGNGLGQDQRAQGLS